MFYKVFFYNRVLIMLYVGYRKRRLYRRKPRRVYTRKSTGRNRVSRTLNRRKWKRKFDKPTSHRIKQTVTTDQVYCKLKYHTQIDVSGDPATYVSKIFRGNSLYDPDFSLGGHQPTGFDQYTAFYTNYLVFGAKISVTLLNSDDDTINVYVIPYKGSLAPAWMGDANYDPKEQPYARGGMFSARSINMNKTAKTIKHYMSTKKMYTVKGELEESEFGALTGNTGTGSNPTNEWAWMIYATCFGFNDGGVAIPIHILGDVNITYYCKFYGRKMVALS